MERLLTKKDGKFYFKGKEVNPQLGSHDMSPNDNLKLYNYFIELADKLEGGQLIEMPCRVGDTFWGFADGKNLFSEPIQYTVKGIELRSDGLYMVAVYDMRFKYNAEAVLTKEEAEVRLAELKGNKQ